MSAIEHDCLLEDDAGLVEPDAEEDTTLAPAAADTSVRTLQTTLVSFGWTIEVTGKTGPQTFDAVQQFQRGFAWWKLVVDGYAGPKTWEAIEYARARAARCSPNFSFKEFKCRCSGTTKGCIGIKLDRDLVLGLEEYRETVGHAVVLRSGYRDPRWNKLRGGAPNSQHLYGRAVDLASPELSLGRVRSLKRFSGIGFVAANGLVLHCDVRTNASPQKPTIWSY